MILSLYVFFWNSYVTIIILAGSRVSSFEICGIIFPYSINYIFLNIKIFFLLLSSRYLVVKYSYDHIANKIPTLTNKPLYDPMLFKTTPTLMSILILEGLSSLWLLYIDLLKSNFFIGWRNKYYRLYTLWGPSYILN